MKLSDRIINFFGGMTHQDFDDYQKQNTTLIDVLRDSYEKQIKDLNYKITLLEQKNETKTQEYLELVKAQKTPININENSFGKGSWPAMRRKLEERDRAQVRATSKQQVDQVEAYWTKKNEEGNRNAS